MRIIEAGHVYELNERFELGQIPAGHVPQTLTFVNREPGKEHGGTTTQEVLRALIDRTRYCNNCMPHPNNERIVYHMRMAIALHEARALERKVQKNDMAIENIQVGKDLHLDLTELPAGDNSTPSMTPYTPEWAQSPNYEPKNGD